MNLIRSFIPLRESGKCFKALSVSICFLFATLTFLSSCSMINEDLKPCAEEPNTFVNVNFVYDYNMTGKDLFDEHVGSVFLYIFDSDSIFRYRRVLHKAEMTGGIDFSMQFDTTELKPGQTYHLVAMANGNHLGYTASLETPGFVKTDLVEGESRISDYIIKLDRDEDGDFDFGVVNYQDAYGNNQAMIDTVWSTKPDEVQTIQIPSKEDHKPSLTKLPDVNVDVTIPMMRLTNAVTVNLLAPNFEETTDPNIFNVLVYFPHGNGTIDFTGTVYSYQPLYYRTLRKNMVLYVPLSERGSRADGDKFALQAEFGVSRLQMNDESSLQVRDAETNELISEIPDFSQFLAHAFDYYGDDGQEFLDREYEFEVTLALEETGPNDDPQNNWAYIELKVLDWVVRINKAIF
ncbi:MAG: FimB/Mfa2 family fimbrial subunit [Muribaculaceae bacterium]|nr:FimB/Mfa2 family fimbrial subunit [Muribaculaceae bacterium]